MKSVGARRARVPAGLRPQRRSPADARAGRVTREITRDFTFVRHDGGTYVRLDDVLGLLAEVGSDEMPAPEMARMLRSTERQALADTHDLVELVVPRGPRWRWTRRRSGAS